MDRCRILCFVLFYFLALPLMAQEKVPGLTEAMVRNVILTWYAGTNEHRPLEDLQAMLAEDVEMRYPNVSQPFVGKAKFKAWYEDVLEKFFDETHQVESWNIHIEGQQATAIVIVRWERRWWTVREVRSHYEASLSRQRFEIVRNPSDGRVLIRKKIVETFEKTAPVYQVGG